MDTTTETTASLAFLLQTTDALFPTGAYAHSLGLEQMAREGLVHDEKTLLEFLREQTLPALSRLELPYLRWAFESALAGDFEALREIDREIGAWKLCRETREASLQLGARRLRALQTMSRAVFAIDFQGGGHHLAVYGAQMALGGLPLEPALTAWLYQALAGACGAALKLIRIGQDGCQRALWQALRGAPAAVKASLAVVRGDAGWFNPLLEIASMRHERAFERLFIS